MRFNATNSRFAVFQFVTGGPVRDKIIRHARHFVTEQRGFFVVGTAAAVAELLKGNSTPNVPTTIFDSPIKKIMAYPFTALLVLLTNLWRKEISPKAS